MKRLLLWKRIIACLCLFLLLSPSILGQDLFDVYDSYLKNNLEKRVKVEIDRTAVKNDYGHYELEITGVRLKVQKGFEISDQYLRSSRLGSGRLYDLSLFSLIKEDETWKIYTAAANQFHSFDDIYSCDWNTGNLSVTTNFFFYVKNIKIAPVKDLNGLYNIFDYYNPGSASLGNEEILVSKNIKIPDPIQIVKGSSPLSVRLGAKLEIPEINIDGGDLSLIAPEETGYLGRDLVSDKISVNSGSLHLFNTVLEVGQFDMKSGSLALDGQNISISSLSVSDGSISYKKRDFRSSYINTLNIEGNVAIISEDGSIVDRNIGYLAEIVNLKNAVVDIQNHVADTSCGANKANPFVKEEITIDSSTLAFKNTNLDDIKSITISGNSNVEMNNISTALDESLPVYLQGGTLIIDSSEFFYSLEQEGGLLQIKNSFIQAPILLKGADAKAEIISGYFNRPIEVEAGTLDVKGGSLGDVSILMKGGGLNISGGMIDEVVIESKCDILLSGGTYSGMGIIFRKGMTLPPSSSLLAEHYVFAKDYNNMIYPLGKELRAGNTSYFIDNEYKEGSYYYFEKLVPETYRMKETAAYKAAKTADVGPDGKDVKVDGKTIEIFTPEGLAWLAVKSNSDFYVELENGREYLTLSERWDNCTYKLMKDLDMTGYGEDWPSINVEPVRIFDGQGHRVYNLNITGKGRSFIGHVGAVYSHGVLKEQSVVTNLIVEGSYSVSSESYGGGNYAGLAVSNDGRIINCAFIGTIYIEKIGYVSLGGLVGSNSGSIENCYVNTCGGLIGGIRPNIDVVPDYTYPCRTLIEEYEVAKLVSDNSTYDGEGVVENCYFAGVVDFDNQYLNNPDITITMPGLAGGSHGGYGTLTNCYDGPDVSLQTLNKNVQNHKQDADYPWSTWAVDPNKQCGMPYLSFATPIPPDDDDVIIDSDRLYDISHMNANVTVKSGAIYTINEAGASIASLTVEDGGQVRLRKPLCITDSIAVKRYFETDKWTTLCIPEIMMLENNLWDMGLTPDQRPIWSKYGYMDEKTQQWMDYGADNIIPNRAHLYVARHTSQMGYFRSIESNAPFVWDAVTEPIAMGNVPDGDWFHFVANPYWENLSIEGRAYVLNEAGTSFDLQENPVIPPFRCYMVASEEVMKNISSLRLSDLPTSVEEIPEAGFRVWTEGRTICVETAEEKDVMIYSVSGLAQARLERSTGVRRIVQPSGIYVVVCDGKAVKVVL